MYFVLGATSAVALPSRACGVWCGADGPLGDDDTGDAGPVGPRK